ncbi:MAG: DNA repair protein RecO [Elusimicrobiota bacterium]
MYHVTDGIVLNRRTINEADRQICVWTRDIGKVRPVATGSCRVSARMLSLTEPISRCEFMLYVNHGNSGRVRVVGGELKNMFPDVKKDVLRYTFACKVAEAADLLTAELDKNEKKYFLLLRTYELLSHAKNPEKIYLAFLLRFLRLCGYGIEYNKALNLGKKTILAFHNIGRLSGEDVDSLPIQEQELVGIVENYLMEYVGFPMKTKLFAEKIEKFDILS